MKMAGQCPFHSGVDAGATERGAQKRRESLSAEEFISVDSTLAAAATKARFGTINSFFW